MKPRVILHNAVSLDGRIDRFTVDLDLTYGIAARFEEDATLVGSETLLQSPEGAAFLEDPDETHPPGKTPRRRRLDPVRNFCGVIRAGDREGRLGAICGRAGRS